MTSDSTALGGVPFHVAIVDDDDGWTQSICIPLRRQVPPGWQVVGRLPFDDMAEYLPWVSNNHVAAVLIDLQLSDKMPQIRYTGHDLVAWFAAKLPRLPRFYLTAHNLEQVVKDDEGEVDSIFDKVNFRRNHKRAFDRVVRAAINYQREHYERLGRIAEIAKKAALGTATEDELREVRALSTTRDISTIPAMQTRAAILNDAEALLAKCNDLLKNIESKERGGE